MTLLDGMSSAARYVPSVGQIADNESRKVPRLIQKAVLGTIRIAPRGQAGKTGEMRIAPHGWHGDGCFEELKPK